ncbi:MAG TPA: L,D-transpeptidase [Flavobacteriales bacterium]|jgi:hypothetical protein|nr:L,D-transpeptidase [Flavobacteriales bacterium]HRT54735.1 L,D-transpeptidase [Flavobacteriales bacterium]
MLIANELGSCPQYAADGPRSARLGRKGAGTAIDRIPAWAVVLLLSQPAYSQGTDARHKQALADFCLEYMEVRYPGVDLNGDILYVSVQRQRMFHVRERTMLREYMISTSTQGPGTERNSYRTPTGLHHVSERIGEGVPMWGILKERLFTGELADSTCTDDRDVITSRILWLRGLESGVNTGGNVDSHDRWIYIHGTVNEGSIGTPSSRGCIRMRNTDIITLFNEIPTGTLVLILDN